MNNPQPINALKTRVVKVDDFAFLIQASSDSLSWSNISEPYASKSTAQSVAQSIVDESSDIPSAGEVVWKSY